MVLWFAAIGFSGVASIFYTPEVLKAINPYYAIRFLLDNGIIGFFLYYPKSSCALQEVKHYMLIWDTWEESLS